jgi:membrane associated rhomboid family serine protease
MIPIGDAHRRFAFPWATTLLILTFLVLFVVEHRVSEEGWENLTADHILTPRTIRRGLDVKTLSNAVACLFFQGRGWLQPIANIVYLWILGRKIEDACGPGGVLVLCLFCGVGGILSTGLAFRVIPARSRDDLIFGPAGIVAGLMGAYFTLYQMKPIRTWVPPLMLLPVPAFLHFVYWFGLEFIRIHPGNRNLTRLISLDPKWTLVGALFLGMAVGNLLIRQELLYYRIARKGVRTP